MDRIRFISIGLVLGVVACDPGASFHVEGAPEGVVTWRRGVDSVVARVRASAFTIGLTVGIEVLESNAAELQLDSSTVGIRDRHGADIPLEQSGNWCYHLSADSLHLRCATARGEISTRYGQLDSMTVRFGSAILNGHRVPLTTVFRLDR